MADRRIKRGGLWHIYGHKRDKTRLAGTLGNVVVRVEAPSYGGSDASGSTTMSSLYSGTIGPGGLLLSSEELCRFTRSSSTMCIQSGSI